MIHLQTRVNDWMLKCFNPEIAADKVERCDRFIEEALELAQASGYSAERAHALVDYVFSRKVGEIENEVGGVMITLAAFANAHDVDIYSCAFREMSRIDRPEVIEKIRAKHASKPKGDALPAARGVNRLWAALEEMVTAFDEHVHLPERACGCHISPPCHDCVENAFARDALETARKILKEFTP